LCSIWNRWVAAVYHIFAGPLVHLFTRWTSAVARQKRIYLFGKSFAWYLFRTFCIIIIIIIYFHPVQ
jgi:hypothetical protein